MTNGVSGLQGLSRWRHSAIPPNATRTVQDVRSSGVSMNRLASQLPTMLEQQHREILTEWLDQQMATAAWRAGRIQESQIREESTRFLALFTQALQQGVQYDARSSQWTPVRDMLGDLSRSRATQGFSPSQVATFVFSLKQPLFTRVRTLLKDDATALSQALWDITTLLDSLGLYTTEVYQQARETVIARQQEELIELSTPVVELWPG